jgi:CubicO group peptidase (beta-lactamase class C family)
MTRTANVLRPGAGLIAIIAGAALIAAAHARQGGQGGGAGRGASFLAALRSLDLSADQRAKVMGILRQFRAAGEAAGARKKLLADIDAVLTPEQRAALRSKLAVAAPGAGANTPAAASLVPTAVGTPEEMARYKAAAAYARDNAGLSFLVMKDGKVVYEQYDNGFTPETAHQLASGTKSFWGVLAAAAIDDGLIASLDEKVSDTLTDWKADPRKAKITVRHLLSFTSGLEPTDQLFRNREVKDRYAFCAGRPAVAEPGTVYRYSDVHLYAFGAYLKAKLAAKAAKDGRPAEDPLAYLRRRVLEPIGLTGADRWARDAAGNPALPYGATLTAREWAKFGRFLADGGKTPAGKQLISKTRLDTCLVGSKANPAYGLTFWLNREPGKGGDGSVRLADGLAAAGALPPAAGDVARISARGITPDLEPGDVYMAAGAGQQRLYVLPKHGLVVVRQANADLARAMMAQGGRGMNREMSDARLLALLLGKAGA